MHTCGLQTNMSKKELEESADSAIGLYFTKDSNNFRFMHDALEETIGCHFYKFDSRVMFSDCDILFIRDRVRVHSIENTNTNIHENIVIIQEDELNEDRFRPLYDRLWTELENGRFSNLLMSNLFKNRNFVRIFGITFDKSINTVLVKASSEQKQSNGQSVFKQALRVLADDAFQHVQVNKDAISRVIEARDVRSTLIDWIVAFGCYEFFRYAWSKMTTFDRKLILGRYGTFLPSVESFFPLAVLGGSVDIVKTLIEDGADVNCCSEFLETSLHIAIKTDAVKVLFHEELPKNDDFYLGFKQDSHTNLFSKKLTPKVNIVDNNGLTAVHLAVINNNIDILSLLLRNKAEVNFRDEYYRTPLHYTRSKSVTQLLLARSSQNQCCETFQNVNVKQEYSKTFQNVNVKQEYSKTISACRTTWLNNNLQTAFEDVARDYVNMPDKEGNTPLHSVIERHFSKQESGE
ncbi:unnamed protein product [Mytilus edulis]|uniref:Uncharacterized protein n=1 Tax=Mytilus edulis TaxID=6550 RepID=A0A8S3RAR6_MYTED|nr:unnamed protein product [Mytilus edulis]